MQISHIGSLPFENIEDAIENTFQYSLPVLPTLPKLDSNEFMLEQVSSRIKKAQIVDYKIHLDELELEDKVLPLSCSESFFLRLTKGESFKWQVVGPLTLLASVETKLSFKERDKLLDWHIETIVETIPKSRRDDAYLFLDEPLFFLAEDDDKLILNSFVRKLKASINKLGIHICCDFDPRGLDLGLLDGLSIESKNYPQLRGVHNIDIFLGVLSPINGALDKSLDLEHDNIYLTPHCGLALSSTDLAIRSPNELFSWPK